MKQIGIALHQHNDVRGHLPGVNDALKITPIDWRLLSTGDPNADYPPLYQLIPFIEGEPPQDQAGNSIPTRKVFVSGADPTIAVAEEVFAPASYGLNMACLETRPNLVSGLPDGASNTIAATERYYQSYMNSLPSVAERQRNYTRYNTVAPGDADTQLLAPERRATFADRGFHGEVIPVTNVVNGSPVTRPSVPGQTFQVRPKPPDAWSGVPQTPFAAGLPALMFDGSVRTVSPTVDPSLFWGAVTRDKGEVLTDW